MVEQQDVRRSDNSVKEFGILNDIYVPRNLKEGARKERGEIGSRSG